MSNERKPKCGECDPTMHLHWLHCELLGQEEECRDHLSKCDEQTMNGHLWSAVAALRRAVGWIGEEYGHAAKAMACGPEASPADPSPEVVERVKEAIRWALLRSKAPVLAFGEDDIEAAARAAIEAMGEGR